MKTGHATIDSMVIGDPQWELNMDEMIEQVAPTNVSLDDLEDLINSLSPDEVAELAECDPDVSLDYGQECFLYQDY